MQIYCLNLNKIRRHSDCNAHTKLKLLQSCTDPKKYETAQKNRPNKNYPLFWSVYSITYGTLQILPPPKKLHEIPIWRGVPRLAMFSYHPGVRNTFFRLRDTKSRVALSHKNHVNLLVSDAQILQTHGSESPGPSERKKFRVTRGCCCKNFATHWAQLVFLKTTTKYTYK